MRFSSTGLIAILASTVAGAPAVAVTRREALATNPPLQITDLVIAVTADGKTSLSYKIQNPEPLANGAEAVCQTSWNTAEKNWPKKDTDVKCGDSLFDFHIEEFTSEKNFVIGLQDSFNDPSVGKPPYDRVTVFAKATIDETTVTYKEENGDITGNQIADKQIEAVVYATAA